VVPAWEVGDEIWVPARKEDSDGWILYKGKVKSMSTFRTVVQAFGSKNNEELEIVLNDVIEDPYFHTEKEAREYIAEIEEQKDENEESLQKLTTAISDLIVAFGESLKNI